MALSSPLGSVFPSLAPPTDGAFSDYGLAGWASNNGGKVRLGSSGSRGKNGYVHYCLGKPNYLGPSESCGSGSLNQIPIATSGHSFGRGVAIFPLNV